VLLIIFLVVTILILLIASIYFLVYYQHPDDRNTAYFPKFVVIGAFILAGMTLLLFPLDVANNEGYSGCSGFDTNICGGLNMRLFWDVTAWLIFIWIFLLIPFSTFYYEAHDGNITTPLAPSSGESEMDPDEKAKKKKRSRLFKAVFNLALTFAVVSLVFTLSYLFLSHTHIPIDIYTGATILEGAQPAGVRFESFPKTNDDGSSKPFDPNELAPLQPNDVILLRLVEEQLNQSIPSFRVDASTFFTGLVSFIGWFFFVLFGGIGLAALPLEGIFVYLNHQAAMSPEELDDLKQLLITHLNDLVEIGEQLKFEREDKEMVSKAKKKQSLMLKLFPMFMRSARTREFKAAVYLLDKDFEEYTAYRGRTSKKYNPLYPYLALITGCFNATLTLCWVLQTCLFTLPKSPVHPFLNNLLVWLDGIFPMFGLLTVGILMLYLLLCAMKGCFLFGVHFVCVSFYPMKVGKTYMTAFLFNMGLILYMTMPIVQFSVISFEEYAKNSIMHQMYLVEIEYLDFFVYFFENNVFIYTLLIIAFLNLFFLIWRYKYKINDGERLRKRLKARSGLTREESEEHFEDEPLINRNPSSDMIQADAVQSEENDYREEERSVYSSDSDKS